MAKKTCFYCGTTYSEEEKVCPVCGQSQTEEEEKKPVVDDSVFEEREDPRARSPKGSGIVSTIICILLALAVVIGALFILKAMNVFGAPTQPAQSQTQLPTDPAAENPAAATACTALIISPTDMTFTEAGQKTILTIMTDPADCGEPIELLSSDPTVAAVTPAGEVIAVTEGEAVISVSCGSFTKTANVVCKFLAAPVPVAPVEPTVVDLSKFKLNREDFTLLKKGETFQMKLSGGTLPDGAKVEWVSDDPTVAEIDANGLVTAIAPGRTDVHARVGGGELSCIVRCSFKGTGTPATPAAQPTSTPTTPATPSTPTTPADPVEYTNVQTTPTQSVATASIDISHSDVTLRKGESFKVFLYSGTQRLSGVSWQTQNASVCTVAGDGTATAVGSGTTSLVGTLEGRTYSCIVRVP